MEQRIFNETEGKMKKTVDAVRKELASLRTGRASVSLLEGIKVEYYGNLMPVNQVAQISIPEPKAIEIKPWDKNMIPEIEKAISKSNLGLSTANDGAVIRLGIPPLTGERRQELCRVVKKVGEDGKISIRNSRHEGNTALDAAEKNKQISEDSLRKSRIHMQKLTDQYISEVDLLVANKEKEILG